MNYRSLGVVVRRDDYCSTRIFERHCHTYYEILYVLKGSVNFDLEGQRIQLTENTGIVIEPLRYQMVTGNDSVYHRLILCFNKELVPAEIAKSFSEKVKRNCVFRTDVLSQLFERLVCIRETNDPAFYPLRDAIFTEILYSIAYDNAMEPEPAQSKRAEKLRRIIAYVDENLDKEVRLSDIAAVLHMSQSSVCHIFKEEMKISLKQYILQKKMMYAKALLQQGMSPGAAALACGYSNYASFYKVYTKITGNAPSVIIND